MVLVCLTIKRNLLSNLSSWTFWWTLHPDLSSSFPRPCPIYSLCFTYKVHNLKFFFNFIMVRTVNMEFTSLKFFFFLIFTLYFFIYFWLRWVFVSVRGLSLFAASEGHSSSRCTGLSLLWLLLLRSTGSKRAGSVLVAHGPSCSVACGIFPDQGSNPCPLHWQAYSQPLRHQGSPNNLIFFHLLI